MRREPVNELRILQLIPVLAIGGLERVAQRLTLLLTERGAHVAVAGKTGVASRWGGPTIEQPLRAAEIPMYHLTRPRPRPDRLLRASIELAQILRREQPDVIHAHNPTAGVAAAIARRLASCPQTAIVTTFHGVQPDRMGRAARALATSSDIVVGVGPSSTRALIASGLPENRTATIFNSVAATATRAREDVLVEFGVADSELVVTVGRYAPEKNQALLLDALAMLAPRRSRLRALLVGAGDLEGALTTRMMAEGLGDTVRITGPRPDAADLIAAADVFALTSDSEALPLVLLEAMQGRTAIVATDVGGVRDLLGDGIRGMLVPARDPVALAEAIEKVLEDGELRTQLVTRAETFVRETCSEDAMVDAYARTYIDAVSRRRSRAARPRTGASPSK